MQLTVTISPYYQKDLKGTYPKLARNLGYLDSSLPTQNPSLYELVGQLDQLLYRHDGTPLRDVLLRHSEKLRNLHKNIQDNIADWKLAQADKLLYSIEDTFDDIESELE
jgi:molecular chaperone GrpE (heat shock protein)